MCFSGRLPQPTKKPHQTTLEYIGMIEKVVPSRSRQRDRSSRKAFGLASGTGVNVQLPLFIQYSPILSNPIQTVLFHVALGRGWHNA
jgi:hypothetical protein